MGTTSEGRKCTRSRTISEFHPRSCSWQRQNAGMYEKYRCLKWKKYWLRCGYPVGDFSSRDIVLPFFGMKQSLLTGSFVVGRYNRMFCRLQLEKYWVYSLWFTWILSISVKCRLQTPGCRLGVKCSPRVKCRLQTTDFLSIYLVIFIIECSPETGLFWLSAVKVCTPVSQNITMVRLNITTVSLNVTQFSLNNASVSLFMVSSRWWKW